MKVWRAGLAILAGANLEKDWYFEPGFNVTLETFKGPNHVTTGILKNLFTSFEPPVIDEITNTVNVAETFVDQNGNQVGNQTYFTVKKGQQPLYPNIVGCRNPDTLAEMMEDWRSKINDHYEIDRSRDMHAGLWSPDMTHWEHCTEDCYTLPANKDLPPITTCGFYVAPYVWDDFDPNKNYIGAAIMAVKDGDKWYNDGRQEPFSIEARNGWYSDARIRPGYIIMREADYLQDRYRDPDVNPECNGDRAQCPTFHSALLQDFLWGKSIDFLRKDEVSVVGWGFSYQAKESRPPYDYKCDYKFKSYTFNAGVATLGDLNLSIFNHTSNAGCATQDFRNPDCAQNTLGERLEGYLKIAINRFRANPRDNRLTRVSVIQRLMKENESRLDSPWNDLLKCKKDPQI